MAFYIYTGAEISALLYALSNHNQLTDAMKAKLDNLNADPDGAYQRRVHIPTITSSLTLPTFAAGGVVAYRASCSDSDAQFKLIDADGTGIVMDSVSGTMYGGSGAAAGTYNLTIIAASVFGVSDETILTLTVS